MDVRWIGLAVVTLSACAAPLGAPGPFEEVGGKGETATGAALSVGSWVRHRDMGSVTQVNRTTFEYLREKNGIFYEDATAERDAGKTCDLRQGISTVVEATEDRVILELDATRVEAPLSDCHPGSRWDATDFAREQARYVAHMDERATAAADADAAFQPGDTVVVAAPIEAWTTQWVENHECVVPTGAVLETINVVSGTLVAWTRTGEGDVAVTRGWHGPRSCARDTRVAFNRDAVRELRSRLQPTTEPVGGIEPGRSYEVMSRGHVLLREERQVDPTCDPVVGDKLNVLGFVYRAARLSPQLPAGQYVLLTYEANFTYASSDCEDNPGDRFVIPVSWFAELITESEETVDASEEEAEEL